MRRHSTTEMDPPQQFCKGFTLLEIMVALAVLAIAMAAIITQASQNIANLVKLRDHSIAHWVAMNHITELQLQKEWPATGHQSGSVEMAQSSWHWDTRISATDDDAIRRLDIDINKDQDTRQPGLEHMIAYLGRPTPSTP